MKLFIYLVSLIIIGSAAYAFGPSLPQANRESQIQPPFPNENELILYTIPSPREISWDSPRKLVGSVLSNTALAQHGKDGTHSIGHVFIGLNVNGRKLLAGMTSEGNAEGLEMVTQRGYGLGSMGADMHGKLQSSAELEAEVRVLCKDKGFGYLRYKLSPPLAQRLLTYFDEYCERGCDKHYGGFNRPRYGEGGGCSAFGVSFLDVAGLLEQEHREKWTVDVRIPEHLYGGPYTGKHVSLAHLAALGPLAHNWAKAKEAHVRCFMWEPTLMYRWIVKKRKELQDVKEGPVSNEQAGCALGLVVDARGRAVPTEPIWKDPKREPNPYGWHKGLHWARESEKQTTEDEFAISFSGLNIFGDH